MNTVRTLICITFALLIAALVHSYSTQNKGSKDKSLDELRDELEKVRLENQIKRERSAASPLNLDQFSNPENISQVPELEPKPLELPTESITPAQPNDETQAELARLAAENEKLKKKQAQQESENKMLHSEAGVIQNELLTRKKPEETRAAEIAQALVMARVKTFDEKSQIIVLDLIRAQNLNVGQIMGIRRGTAGGIIGRIRIANIEGSNLGFADPIPESFFDGPVDVKVGDEIIVIP
jgi:hypothetical protein